nr:retrotransposon protein, putative, unclassified [Tanacetum cinerariifolium]
HVDNVYSDRNLICTLQSPQEYEEKAENLKMLPNVLLNTGSWSNNVLAGSCEATESESKTEKGNVDINNNVNKEHVHCDKSDLVPRRQKASDYDNSNLVPQLQNVSPSADTTVPSQHELDLLFEPLYDEFFTAEQVRGNLSKPVQTRRQLATDPEMCMFALTVSTAESKNIKEEMADSAWIEAVQEELHQFDRLQAKYALEILQKHGMEKGQSIGTPMATKHKLNAELSGNLVDQTDYSSKIGSLVYLTSSRPDIVVLGDKLVSWMSKKQVCTEMSSAEAEYVALSVSCDQVMWMRTQLQDYGLNYNKILLYCDSQSAIAISCNPVQHSCTKHIYTRYHFIKEQVEKAIIELYFVRTEYPLADMFNKALPEDRFKYLVRRIGMRCLTLGELEVL